jgi:polyisoprenoid-binding protein YceI
MLSHNVLKSLTLAAAAFMAGIASPSDHAAAVQDSFAGDVTLEQPDANIRWTVATTGNAARYRVREQLMGRDLPNDAVGETKQVSGAIVTDESGAIVPSGSRITVSIGDLTSDNDRRDNYVRRRVLETEKFPTVVIEPTAVRGITKIPVTSASAGPLNFQLLGNLTVKGVTRPTVWQVTWKLVNGQVTGSASTKFAFDDFGIPQPRVPIVLSVADTIALEYDFTLVREK